MLRISAAGRLRRAERGMGLVETLVSIGLLGVGVLAFVGALSTGSVSVNESGQEATSQRLAQSQIETIKAAPYDVSGVGYSTVTAPSGYAVAFVVNSSLYPTADIQQITVTVSRDGAPVLTVQDYKVNR